MSGHEGLLAGKIVIVTGAGSGIGRAAALLFGNEGATVCVLDRDQGLVREQSDKLWSQHGSPS